MKYQALFSSKDKSRKISVVCCKFLFSTLRINTLSCMLSFKVIRLSLVPQTKTFLRFLPYMSMAAILVI